MLDAIAAMLKTGPFTAHIFATVSQLRKRGIGRCLVHCAWAEHGGMTELRSNLVMPFALVFAVI